MALKTIKCDKSQQVGNDIAASANENKVIRISFFTCLHVCFSYVVVSLTCKPVSPGNACHGVAVQCSFACGLCEIVCSIFRQKAHNGVYVFVVHHAENNSHGFALLPLDLFRKILPSGNVMSCVAYGQRLV